MPGGRRPALSAFTAIAPSLPDASLPRHGAADASLPRRGAADTLLLRVSDDHC
eukprot:gene9199-20105_t